LGCGSFVPPILVQWVACITGVSILQTLRLVGSEIDLFNTCSGWMDTVSVTREGWFCTGLINTGASLQPSGMETTFRCIRRREPKGLAYQGLSEITNTEVEF
jgi:hypothetical protein